MPKYHRKGATYTSEGWSIIHGHGIYDCTSPYKWREVVDGKTVVVHCPYFPKWKSIIQKSFCQKVKAKNPAYKDATMCYTWLHFSNFKKWVDSQPNKDWEGCEIDKDLLYLGNKHYSSNTCCFISQKLNGFLKYVKVKRGECMIGVSYKKGAYQADCSNPYTGKKVYLGRYNTELDAHLAWKAYKHKISLLFMETETDIKIKTALSSRYAPETDWTNK